LPHGACCFFSPSLGSIEFSGKPVFLRHSFLIDLLVNGLGTFSHKLAFTEDRGFLAG